MTQLLDLKAAQAALVRAVENSPKGKRNPTDHPGGICVYTSATDPDDHCIVGQVLADAGLEVPEMDVGFSVVSTPHVERGDLTQSAADFLNECQKVFDGPSSISPTWRQALGYCRRLGYLDGEWVPPEEIE